MLYPACEVCSEGKVAESRVVPRHEDEPGRRGFTDRIRALHRKLHGNRVDGETEKAKEGTDDGHGHFLLPHQRHLRERFSMFFNLPDALRSSFTSSFILFCQKTHRLPGVVLTNETLPPLLGEALSLFQTGSRCNHEAVEGSGAWSTTRTGHSQIWS